MPEPAPIEPSLGKGDKDTPPCAAALCGGVFWMLRQREQQSKIIPPVAAPSEPLHHIAWSDVTDAAPITVELGYGLVDLVDDRKGAPLMGRITGIRRQLSRELGFVLPLVKVKDNLSLDGNAYRITISGVVMGEDMVHPRDLLALDSGECETRLTGHAVKDPCFGLDAVWIDPSQRDHARTLGYTVVDGSTAISTHLNKVLRENAADLISHDDTQQLLDKLAAKSPKLVEDLVPGKLSLGALTRVLQQLLSESVSIRDIRTIAETLADATGRTTDPEQLTAVVRPKLGRMIMQSLIDEQSNLSVMTLEPGLEQLLHNVLQQSQPGQPVVLEPNLSESLFASLRAGCRFLEEEGHPAVLVVSPLIRGWLAKAAKQRVNDLTVLSYSEIPDDQAVKVIHTVDVKSRKADDELN